MGSQSPSSYSAPPCTPSFAGFLWDMDGTIIDSTDAIVKHWHKISKEIGVDPEVVLQTSHGRRSIDVLKLLDPSKANWEYVKHMEGLIPREYGSDAVEIRGSRALLSQLTEASAPWAIVTSGTLPLVTGWLSVLGFPFPDRLVVAEDVANGKPDPACYLLGLQKLDLPGGAGDGAGPRMREGGRADVLVLEDSPAGIRAGKKAGCKVLGLVTTHTVEQVVEAGADWIVRDLSSVKLVGREEDGGYKLEIRDSLSN